MRKLAALLLMACGTGSEPALQQQAVATEQKAVGADRGRFAIEWMELVTQRIVAEELAAPEAARVYGYAGVALHEVARYSAPEVPPSLATQLNSLGELPTPRADVVIDWNVAVASAMSELVEIFFYSQESRDAVENLRAQQLGERRLDGVTEMCADASILFGAQVAKAIAQWAREDGFAEAQQQQWVTTQGEGAWEPTRADTVALHPFFGTVRPFALVTNEDCRAEAPARFSTRVDSPFFQEALLTMRARQDITDAERQALPRWKQEVADWMSITSERLSRDDSRLARAGKTYALIGIALADSYVSAWQDKYRTNLLRPVTFIQRYIDDDWAPLAETPAYPEYISSPAAAAASAAELLTLLYGDAPIEYAGAQYPSYWDAALEASETGLYSGLHFPMSIDAGIDAGYCVAHRVLDRVRI